MSNPKLPWPMTARAMKLMLANLRSQGDLVDASTESGLGVMLQNWHNAGRVSVVIKQDLWRAFELTDVSDDCFSKVKLTHTFPFIFVEHEPVIDGLVAPGVFAWEDREHGITLGVVLSRDHGQSWEVKAIDPREDGEGENTWCATWRVALTYLMDPAREESRQPLHGNREWRQAMRACGVTKADDVLSRVNHRVLGGVYRLPAEARDPVQPGGKLMLRVPVRGHMRMQPFGTNRSEVRPQWIKPHWRGPKDAPTIASVIEVR